ncbi:MAG TPA: hypothetical protein VHW04_15040 [Solirubrobacteraceae bacterium]|nr:hypothetical protein [Solirubrobacteraceae bacterium]
MSIWLDTLSRQLLGSGDFATLIRDCRVELFFGLALDASRV